MMFVLDTNVVSELRKIRLNKADINVTAWAESVDATDLFVSAITVMELELGVLSVERKDATQGAMLRSWLEQQVLPEFACCRLVQRSSQHPALHQQHRPQYLDALADTDFLKVRGRRDHLPLPFVGLAHVIGKAEEHTFLVGDNERLLIHLVHHFVQRLQCQVVAAQ
ncbi:MAG TPA: hypothetical protein VF534_05625 [Paraburkholderia sp.]